MEINYDEMSIYQELKFLNELVNINEYSYEDDIKEFNYAVEHVQKYIKKIIKKIGFNKINISDLFSFLNL